MKIIRNILKITILIFISNNALANSNNVTTISIKTTLGEFQCQLYDQKEPELVKYYKSYINEKYYNHLIFHRIINGFIIQSGLYDANFKEKKSQIYPQIKTKHDNIKNASGTLAIIIQNNKNKLNAPQFYINLNDNNNINSINKNAEFYVIGKVINGQNTIKKIAHIKVGQKENLQYTPFYPNEAEIIEISIVKN